MSSAPLESDKYYHIYNHANGSDNLFRTEENYYFFLSKYSQHIVPIADTFAYCLMPNHFHFLIRIKEVEKITKFFQSSKTLAKNPQGFQNLEGLISQRFGNFFNSYSKAYNKVFNRKGALFQQNFKRKQVADESYFRKLVHYIHYNPVHHGFTKDMTDWKYSSYWSLLSKKQTLLARKEVIEWFDDEKHFREFHQKGIEEKMVLECEF